MHNLNCGGLMNLERGAKPTSPELLPTVWSGQSALRTLVKADAIPVARLCQVPYAHLTQSAESSAQAFGRISRDADGIPLSFGAILARPQL